jgi:hypothetical protein
MNYAPKEINEYRLVDVACDVVTLCQAHHRGEALWNLFWLSTPSIESVCGRPDWWRVYKPDAKAFHAMTADVEQDEVLFRKLLMPPSTFLLWFRNEDPSIYDTFPALGGGAWVEDVLHRAHLAAERLDAGRGLREITGNVITVQFGKRA